MNPIDDRSPMTVSEELADAVERGDLEVAGTIVAKHLFSLVLTDWRGLVEVIERLPAAFVAANPAVELVKDFGRSAWLESGAMNSEAVATMSSDAATAAGLPDEIVDAVLLQEMATHRLRSDFTGAQAIAGRLRVRISRADERGRRPVHDLVPVAALQNGITELLAADFEQSLRDFADAQIFRRDSQNHDLERDAQLKTAAVHAMLGRPSEAERLLNQAERMPEPRESFADFVAATDTAVRALIAVDRLDPQAPELIRLSSEREVGGEFWSLPLLASVRWSIANGDPVAALDETGQTAAAHPLPAGSLAAGIALAGRAQALTMLGEYRAAARLLDESGDYGVRDTSVVRVRIALHVDGPEAAIAAARKLTVQPGLGSSARAEAMLITAWAQTLLFGAPEAATAQPLSALIAREGLWRVLQLVPAEVVAQLPGVDAAPAFERRLALPQLGRDARFTPNELQILRSLAGPDPLPAIARARHVTLNTVKTQVAAVYRGLGVHNRRAAVAEAKRRGILGPVEN